MGFGRTFGCCKDESECGVGFCNRSFIARKSFLKSLMTSFTSRTKAFCFDRNVSSCLNNMWATRSMSGRLSGPRICRSSLNLASNLLFSFCRRVRRALSRAAANCRNFLSLSGFPVLLQGISLSKFTVTTYSSSWSRRPIGPLDQYRHKIFSRRTFEN